MGKRKNRPSHSKYSNQQLSFQPNKSLEPSFRRLRTGAELSQCVALCNDVFERSLGKFAQIHSLSDAALSHDNIGLHAGGSMVSMDKLHPLLFRLPPDTSAGCSGDDTAASRCSSIWMAHLRGNRSSRPSRAVSVVIGQVRDVKLAGGPPVAALDLALVATNVNWRRRGFATRLCQMALVDQCESAALVVIRSQADVFQKLGAARTGRITHMRVDCSQLAASAGGPAALLNQPQTPLAAAGASESTGRGALYFPFVAPMTDRDVSQWLAPMWRRCSTSRWALNTPDLIALKSAHSVLSRPAQWLVFRDREGGPPVAGAVVCCGRDSGDNGDDHQPALLAELFGDPALHLARVCTTLGIMSAQQSRHDSSTVELNQSVGLLDFRCAWDRCTADQARHLFGAALTRCQPTNIDGLVAVLDGVRLWETVVQPVIEERWGRPAGSAVQLEPHVDPVADSPSSLAAGWRVVVRDPSKLPVAIDGQAAKRPLVVHFASDGQLAQFVFGPPLPSFDDGTLDNLPTSSSVPDSAILKTIFEDIFPLPLPPLSL